MNFPYLNIETQEAIIRGLFIVLGIIIFLWGRAVGVNQTTEDYKIKDKKSEVLELRRRCAELEDKNKRLMAKNKLYMETFSGFRHLVRKTDL